MLLSLPLSGCAQLMLLAKRVQAESGGWKVWGRGGGGTVLVQKDNVCV